MSSCVNCHGSNVRHTSRTCPKQQHPVHCPEKNCGYVAEDRWAQNRHYERVHINYLTTKLTPSTKSLDREGKDGQ